MPYVALVDLIDRAVEASRQATAVEFGGTRLTYAELAGQSDDVARRLAAAGVGPGATVAVSLSRTPDVVAVLLGILKAGAAYVPIDPTLPPRRRAFMRADAGAALELADDNWATVGLPASTPPAAMGPRGAGADDLAYVIYTSGSTGQPKGVEIPHRALSNFVCAMQRRPGLVSTDRVLAHTTLSFDIHVLELWVPLALGATVVLVDQATAADPGALARHIGSASVSLVQATPAMWSLLLRAGWREGLGVKALVGGEALSRDLADALLRTGVDLWNMYGPTETTVWSSAWHVDPTGPILIGDPITATALHVLSEDLAEPPAGGIGELCISGAGLARGYRHRPDLTDERFVQLPGRPATRIYRTGDLARRDADGSIECLGRIDDQVKVGGHRIETGEVEAALRRVPGVRDALVMAATGALGLRQLVAYLVATSPESTDGAVLNGAVLRRALASELPAYMIPSAYVPLPAFPLTPSGKVDRAALPPPPPVAAAIDRTAPETPTETALQALWCEVLGLGEVGVCQDFFDAGGHSRLAAHLFALIGDRFSVRLPLPLLVEAPTIRQLAAAIDGYGHAPDVVADGVLAMPPRGSVTRPPLVLVHAAGGHGVLYRDLARHLAPHVPLFVLQSRGLDGREAPRQTVESMAAAYVEALKRIQPSGPYAIGGASFGGVVAWEMAVRLRASGENVGLLALLDSAFPPIGASRAARLLTRHPALYRWAYPSVRRILSHLGAARRLGAARYLRWLFRDRHAARRARDERIMMQVGPAGRDLFDALSRVRAANERALVNHAPRPYDGHVLFCRARDGHDEIDTRDWWQRTGAHVTYADVPGDHGTMLLEPHVATTAHVIRGAWEALDTTAASNATSPPPPPHRQYQVPA